MVKLPSTKMLFCFSHNRSNAFHPCSDIMFILHNCHFWIADQAFQKPLALVGRVGLLFRTEPSKQQLAGFNIIVLEPSERWQHRTVPLKK